MAAVVVLGAVVVQAVAVVAAAGNFAFIDFSLLLYNAKFAITLNYK